MKKEIKEKIFVYTDGGARGNPGPAALGVVIEGLDKSPKEYQLYLGELTNNEAEYQAIIFALKKLKQLLGKEKIKNTKIEILSDSELVIRQLKGEYKVKEKNLQLLFMEVWNLKFDFPHLTFKLIPREKNRRADQLVNNCLDQEANKLFL